MLDSEKVYEWQSIFGAGGRHTVSDVPRTIGDDLASIRVGFIEEELDEYLSANLRRDLTEILDALCDLQYFVLGMVAIHGFQPIFEEAFEIVHQSNMSKLGEDGKPILREDGKIIKGPGYWKPTEKLALLLNSRKGQ